MVGASDMEIAQPDTGGQEQDAGTEIPTEQELVGRRCLRAAADGLLPDLAEGLIEGRRARRRPRRGHLMKDPWRPVRIEPADLDLVEQIGEARWIGGVGAGLPERTNGPAE